MIKKLIVFFCLTVLGFSSKLAVLAKEIEPTPTPISVVEEEFNFSSMTTYEMFWPITAGKVPGDKFYQVKLWRDKLAINLIFDKLKKSEYLKQLANKRLVEAEKLLEIKRDSFLSETLTQSYKYLEEGLSLLSKVEETPQAWWLKDEYRKDLKKHFIVLGRMKEKVEESHKSVIEDSIKNLDSLIVKYSLGIEK